MIAIQARASGPALKSERSMVDSKSSAVQDLERSVCCASVDLKVDCAYHGHDFRKAMEHRTVFDASL